MKKLYTRIAACSLAVLIAFNTVAIPKAEASMSMLSVGFSTALSAYLNGIGFTIDAKCGGPLEDIAYDVREWHENTIMPIWEKYEKAIDATFDYATLIANGVNMSMSKQVRFSPELCSIFSEFAAWLISEFSLIGEDGEPVAEPVEVFSNVAYVLADGSPVHYYSADFIGPSNLLESDGFYSFSDGVYYNTSSGRSFCGFSGGFVCFYDGLDGTGNQIGYIGRSTYGRYGFVFLDDNTVGLVDYKDWHPYGYFVNVKPSLSLSLDEFFGGESGGALDVSLAPSYAGTPDVAENQEFVIALPSDSDITTWDGFRDYVAQRDLEGVYTPEAVTVEDAQAGTTEGEDTEEDTATIIGTTNRILDWTKKIWSSIQSIPQSIAEAIKGIFVPDAALTTEITDAFAAKFSFVPTLHGLGTDLLSIGPDSKPPVVYIHLEDAEGAIDYGGTTKALDMSWYQRYKEDGDRIIGGFLWLGFLWLLFKRVPAIINGGEMVQEYTAAIDRGSKRRKH